jgi:Flp pilus assembly protein TadD
MPWFFGQLLLPLAALISIAAAGCAGWQPHTASSPTGSQRERRADEVVRDFEARRDAAQLQAALDRWRQGDAPGSAAMLAALVERRPDWCEARMRLADVLWSLSDPAAEAQLRAVIEREPERAEAYHALALVLEATGRLDEARSHLERACQLAPHDELYRQTRDALAGVVP